MLRRRCEFVADNAVAPTPGASVRTHFQLLRPVAQRRPASLTLAYAPSPHIHFLYENKAYGSIYTLVLEGSENGIPCEPQIRCMRASGTLYVNKDAEVIVARK